MYSSIIRSLVPTCHLPHLLLLLNSARLPHHGRFTIDVQTFTNLLLLVVPGGAVYFWTRGDQLDEEAMAAKMTRGMGIVLCCTRYVSRCLGIVLHDGVHYRNDTPSVDASCLPRPVCCLKATSR